MKARRHTERRERRASRLRRLGLTLGVLGVLLLATLVSGGFGGVGTAQAQDDEEQPIDNRAMCWRTDVGDGGFGDYNAADLPSMADLWAQGIKNPSYKERTLPNFGSRSILIDQRFYTNFRYLNDHPNFDKGSDEDGYVAWEEFEDDRKTSNKDTRFDAVSARWVDSTNTVGGYQNDPSAVVRQQTAGSAAVAEGTAAQTDGYRQHMTNVQLPNTHGLMSGSADCNAVTGSCSVDITGNVSTTMDKGSQVTWEANLDRPTYYGQELRNPEVSRNTVTAGTAGDWAYIPTQDNDVYDPISDQGDEKLRLGDYPDTDAERIRVVIDLDDKHRQDGWVNFTLTSLKTEDVLAPLFGNAAVLRDVKSGDPKPGQKDESGMVTRYRQSRLLSSEVDHLAEYKNPPNDYLYAADIELVPDDDGRSAILWPVYLTDVAWYLFRMPEGGFSKADAEDDGKAKKLVKGKILPFESGTGSLQEGQLVKRGVSIPTDRRQGVNGFSGNQSFEFDIVEGQRFNEFGAAQSEAELYRRMGIPEESNAQLAALTNWPNDILSPNEPHLLVLTFYEGKVADPVTVRQGTKKMVLHVGLGGKTWTEEVVDEDVGKVPAYRYRRVVCRVLVYPLGLLPGESWWNRVIEGFGSSIDGLADGMMGWLDELKSWFNNWWKDKVLGLGGAVSSATCYGARQADNLAGGGPDEPDLELTAVEAAEAGARDHCWEAQTPKRPVCDNAESVVLGDRCQPLPRLNLTTMVSTVPVAPETPEWVRIERAYMLAENSLAELRRQQWERHRGLPSGTFVAAPGEGDPAQEGGLFTMPAVDSNIPVTVTEVTLDWSANRMPDSVTGYRVYVTPDRKLSGSALSTREHSFFLDRYYEGEVPEDLGGFQGETRSLKFGGLASPWDDVNIPVGDHQLYADRVMKEWPLTEGFTYEVSVAPYVGFPGTRSYQEGMRSEVALLEGGRDLTCLDPGFRDGPPEGGQLGVIYDWYDCGGSGSNAGLGANLGASLGAINPIGGAASELVYYWREYGSDVCGSVMTSIPASLTWDNTAVQVVWSLAMAIFGTGAVLLVIWNSLKMATEHHTEPDGGSAYSLRIFIPRVLLSLMLAALSLLICAMVLTLASDLTCWVSQATGVTLWGFLGSSMGSILITWFDLAAGGNPETGLAMLLVVLVMFIFLLVLFCLVLWQMVLRVILLAVLVAVSPIAMMLYISESTSQWTHTWMRLFAGTTLQQVVVVMVIFLGISFLEGQNIGLGMDSGIGAVAQSFFIGLAALYLAYKVPGLINPAGSRMFDGFGTMLKMAVQAGAVVVGAAAGGAIGAAGAAGSAAGGGAGAAPAAAAPSAAGAAPSAAGAGSSGGGWASSVSDISTAYRASSGSTRTGGDGGDGAGGGAGSRVPSGGSDEGPGGGGSYGDLSDGGDGSAGGNVGGGSGGPDSTPDAAGGGASRNLSDDGAPDGAGTGSARSSGSDVYATPRGAGATDSSGAGGGGGSGGSRWGNMLRGFLRGASSGVRIAQRGNRAVDDMGSGRWLAHRTRLDIVKGDREDEFDQRQVDRAEREERGGSGRSNADRRADRADDRDEDAAAK